MLVPDVRPRSKEDIERCRNIYERLIDPLRACARSMGYALGVHGTLSRDIDLIAVPWVSWAASPKELVVAIQATAARVNSGIAIESDHRTAANPVYFFEGTPGSKPHGRLAWTFHLGGGPYLDLSVIPPRADPAETTDEYVARCNTRHLPKLAEEAQYDAEKAAQNT